ANPLDCVIFEDSITFVVSKDWSASLDRVEKDALTELSRILKKKINIVKLSEDITSFVKEIFSPVTIEKVTLIEHGGRKGVQVKVPASKKGLAIGREGSNIRRVKVLLNRYFEIDEIRVV
ncbi:MAG: NusA-like transcription termination signal-binding factor, partial [Candidatus Bathyarchaeia archaeon]